MPALVCLLDSYTCLILNIVLDPTTASRCKFIVPKESYIRSSVYLGFMTSFLIRFHAFFGVKLHSVLLGMCSPRGPTDLIG